MGLARFTQLSGRGVAGSKWYYLLNFDGKWQTHADKDKPSGTGAGSASKHADLPVITFSAKQISLLEALKKLTAAAKVDYRIEDGVVMIVHQNVPDAETTAQAKLEARSLEIINKMDRIDIPAIEFKRANVCDVFSFLQNASIDHDESGKGVNIILNLGAGDSMTVRRFVMAVLMAGTIRKPQILESDLKALLPDMISKRRITNGTERTPGNDIE